MLSGPNYGGLLCGSIRFELRAENLNADAKDEDRNSASERSSLF